ncbi:MAG: fructose-2,6-bisphosphatase [Desulfovibrionales bacterium]|nr:MAG: fructose-2,6-bisphosphatase [Desulfovibrionales bacterium]
MVNIVVPGDAGSESFHDSDGALAGILEQSGHVLLVRHALAPGTGDPVGFQIDECATQRNLSAQGREQARNLGNQLRAEGVTTARVFSSQWCRCMETAELLGVGQVDLLPALNSFFQEMRLREERTKELLAFLRNLPDGPPVVMVTHQVNISALTGRFTSSGSGVVARIDPQEVHVVRTWP